MLNGFKSFMEWFVENLVINDISIVKIRSDKEFVASDFLVKKVPNLRKSPIDLVTLKKCSSNVLQSSIYSLKQGASEKQSELLVFIKNQHRLALLLYFMRKNDFLGLLRRIKLKLIFHWCTDLFLLIHYSNYLLR